MLTAAWLVRAQPAVATLVSISERAVDDNGNGLPDRLEITALLNVVNAGKYEMRFQLSDQSGRTLMIDGEGTLAVGQQLLTASVAADRMRAEFKDGPFTINNVQVYRPIGNTFGNFAAGEVQPLKTAAYKRDGWDRGPIFGEEEVRLRPIRVAKSGKFRALEVVWEAVTTGGHCVWSGILYVGSKSVRLDQRGDLLPGRSRFVFEFDAGGWARDSGGESSFQGYIDCEDNSERDGSASVRLRVNPREFEAWGAPLPVIPQSMLRVAAGRGFDSGAAQLKTSGSPPGPVQYRLTIVPQGLTANLTGASLSVAAGAQMAPGRYYVEVEAVSGNAVGTGTVVVDVVAPLPLKPDGKHSAGVATARGVRPDEQGRFQTLEVLWPVEVPGGNCTWKGTLTSEGAEPGSALTRSSLAKGKSMLSMAFPGSIVGNSGKPGWLFQGQIYCGDSQYGQGVKKETRLVLAPETFAKRPGLRLRSWVIARVRPGSFDLSSIFLESSGTAVPVFKVVSRTKGIAVKNESTMRIGDNHSLMMQVWADQGVAEGRYYLPATVTLGGKTGTAEVVVDVVRE